MAELDNKQKKQDELYGFPYHHLVELKNGNFSQTKNMPWGYEYISYLYFILEKLKDLNFNSLLDVGCGDGKFLTEAQRAWPDKKFLGLDYSSRAIALAQALNNKVEHLSGDITQDNLLTDKYDLITLVETLEHIPPEKIPNFLVGLGHYLKDNGWLIITVPSKNNIPLPAKHYQHFDLPSLTKTLEPSFKITKHYFLNKKSWLVNLMEGILGNRLWLLNEKHLLNFLYRQYTKHFLLGSEKNTRRICVFCQKIAESEKNN